MINHSLPLLSLPLVALILAACSSGPGATDEAPPAGVDAAGVPELAPSDPPPAIRAWMDRLTVEHAYDPETGFIVAREVVTLPPVLTTAPPLDEAVAAANGRTIIAFATADRCAPCQQYKKDALNDPRVIERLANPSLIATHVEVDRRPDLADNYLGGRAIPMTYAIRDGKVVATLRGQRSADDLLAWLEAQAEG